MDGFPVIPHTDHPVPLGARVPLVDPYLIRFGDVHEFPRGPLGGDKDLVVLGQDDFPGGATDGGTLAGCPGQGRGQLHDDVIVVGSDSPESPTLFWEAEFLVVRTLCPSSGGDVIA